MGGDGYALMGYHSVEARFALRLAADLKNEGVNLWMDRLDIQPTDDWQRTLESAISDCSALVALLSPDYVASAYGKYELAFVEQLHRPLIPVLLRPVAAADWLMGVGASNPIDLTDWYDTQRYQDALVEIINRIAQLSTIGIARLINPERRYLTALHAQIEIQSSTLEYVRLSYQASQPESATFRPAPRIENNWGLNGMYILRDAPLAQARFLHNLKATLNDFPRLVLTGASGAGKTTTLSRLALDAVRAYRANQRSTPLPFVAHLAEWRPNTTFADFLRSQWTLKSDVMDWLARGWVSLYLDGLDELGQERADQISQLNKWLQSSAAPMRVIIACRADAYDDTLHVQLPVINIEDMTDARSQELLHLYLGDVIGAAVWKQLVPQHELLARNPLALRLLAYLIMHSPNADIPRTPAHIAMRYLELVWEREQILQNPDWIPHDDLFERLAGLAFDMLQRGTSSSVDSAYAMQHLGSERLLNALYGAGILTMRGNTTGFMHALLYETLAARRLQHEGLHEYLSRPSLTASGQRRAQIADGIISALTGLVPESEALLGQIADVDPYLAVTCLLTGNPVTDLTRREVVSRLLYSAMAGDDAARAGAVHALEQLSAGEPLPLLLELMRGGSWDERQRASDFLRGASAFISPELLDVLSGWHFDLDANVAAALRQAGDEALPVLLNLLSSADWTKRRGAAWALGELGDKAGVPALVIAAQDAEPSVRREAITALQQTHDADAIPRLLLALRDNDNSVRKAAARAIADVGVSAVPGLLRMMRADNPDARRIAIGVLGRLGETSAIPPLLEALNDTNTDIRGMAVTALGQIAAPEAAQPLQDTLMDMSVPRWTTKTISELTIHALTQIGTEEAMHIADLWRSRQRDTSGTTGGKSAEHAKAVLQSASVRTPKQSASIADLQRAARHVDPRIRQRAVEKLGETGNPDVLPTLLIAARDDENVVRWAALRSFDHFAPTTEIIQTLLRALYDADYSVSDTAAASLARIGQPAVAGLLDVAQDTQHVDARGLALEVLGRIGDAAARSVVEAALDDERKPHGEDRTIASIAAEALASLKVAPVAQVAVAGAGGSTPLHEAFILRPDDDDATDARLDELMRLLEAVRDDDWQTRQRAAKGLLRYARALRGVRTPFITERLIGLLQAQEDFVRLAAVESLAWIGDILAVPALVQTLSDEAWTIRIAAVRALGEIGHTSAIHALTSTLRSDDREQVREVAAEILGRFKHEMALPALVDALDDEAKFVRRAAIESLGELGNREAAPWLVTTLQSGEYPIRWAAAEALGKLGAAEAVDALSQFLGDAYEPPLQDKPERRFSDVVVLALEQIDTPEARTALANWRNEH